MIKLKLHPNYFPSEFIMRKHCNKYDGGGLISYLFSHGYKHLPYFNLDIRFDTDNDILKSISVDISDTDYMEFPNSELNQQLADSEFVRLIKEYFVSHGYPFDSMNIQDEDKMIQFIEQLKEDGFDTDKFFTVVSGC